MAVSSDINGTPNGGSVAPVCYSDLYSVVTRCLNSLINPIASPNPAYILSQVTKFDNSAILSTQCTCLFRMVLTVNSDCFPKQH
jgi:hypothetical protein